MSDILDLQNSSDDEWLDELEELISDDEIQSQQAIKSSKARDKEYADFLRKAYKLRTILKWKFNYFETNPREYKHYHEIVKKSKVHPKTRDFKKYLRLVMDSNFRGEMKKVLKEMKKKKAAEKNDVDSGIHQTNSVTSAAGINVPKYMLYYDRECKRRAHKIHQKYKLYEMYPKLYKDYNQEFDKFENDMKKVKGEGEVNALSRGELDEMFRMYWPLRVLHLIEQELEEEKSKIREDWENLMPRFDGLDDDMETLLIDDSDDDDVVIVENNGN